MTYNTQEYLRDGYQGVNAIEKLPTLDKLIVCDIHTGYGLQLMNILIIDKSANCY